MLRLSGHFYNACVDLLHSDPRSGKRPAGRRSMQLVVARALASRRGKCVRSWHGSCFTIHRPNRMRRSDRLGDERSKFPPTSRGPSRLLLVLLPPRPNSTIFPQATCFPRQVALFSFRPVVPRRSGSRRPAARRTSAATRGIRLRTGQRAALRAPRTPCDAAGALFRGG